MTLRGAVPQFPRTSLGFDIGSSRNSDITVQKGFEGQVECFWCCAQEGKESDLGASLFMTHGHWLRERRRHDRLQQRRVDCVIPERKAPELPGQLVRRVALSKDELQRIVGSWKALCRGALLQCHR